MESGKKNLGFPDDLAVKNPPAMQETWMRSLHWEDPLEKKMATHPSVLAWKLPWTDEPAGVQSMGSQKSQDTTHWLKNNSKKNLTISYLLGDLHTQE